jgi:AraC family transcriptional regulator of adaptative response / DNA-3-methyladenine glycosylase II
MLDSATCYRAIKNRDRRYDGRFFVGVSSTRIYCRPVCPARTPRRDRCSFFPTASDAELAGYLPCLRCRPDLRPGNSIVDAKARLAASAARLIGRNCCLGLEQVAAELGVTTRHLRRALSDELGVTPFAFRRARRLLMAMRLVRDPKLPLIEVALASGFSSLRRFNVAFRQHVGRTPSAWRRTQGAP